jgi:hypothetical protein
LLRDTESVYIEENQKVDNQEISIREQINNNGGNYFSLISKSQSVLGKKDEAVKLLLDTPPKHQDIYKNFFYACVISASNSQTHFKQTMTFVASCLLSFKTDEDIYSACDLLCLIGEGYKACRYLQDFDKWDRAAKLAKCILEDEKRNIILARWANYLVSVKNYMKAISVYLSLGVFKEVIELLYESKMYDLATMFILSCEEYNIPLLNKEIITLSNTIISDKVSSKETLTEDEKTTKLIKQIFAGYGLLLDKIGNKKLSLRYKEKISKITGEDIDEVSFLKELGIENQAEFIYSNEKDQIESEILKNYVESQDDLIDESNIINNNNSAQFKFTQLFSKVIGKNI